MIDTVTALILAECDKNATNPDNSDCEVRSLPGVTWGELKEFIETVVIKNDIVQAAVEIKECQESVGWTPGCGVCWTRFVDKVDVLEKLWDESYEQGE